MRNTKNSQIFSVLTHERTIARAALVLLLLSILHSNQLLSLPNGFFVAALLVLSGLLLLRRFLCRSASAAQAAGGLRDNLTELPNRSLFFEQLRHGISAARRHEKMLVLVKMDIDAYADVNNQYGYEKGDQLLRDVALRLQSAIRECDTVARIGGDEFGMIFNDLEREEETETILHRIMSVMQQPYQVSDEKILLKMSYGVCVYPRDKGTVDELAYHAELAVNSAKSNGGNTHMYYSQDISARNAKRLSDEYSLRQALDKREFVLYFQPKVDAATGTIKGMEALIRWMHPQRGMVSPVEFIPVLEETGLIVDVGKWVIEEACRINQRWQQQGLKPLRVSVNVASPQFKQKQFVNDLKNIVTASGMDPSYLEIELTESCLMDDVLHNIDVLNAIKAMGIAISVDDFGTGYSSLSYLKRFPIDVLKIDRSFIKDIQNRKQNDNAAIVTAIMALSHSLRLDVVAEGVETAQELSYLHALGCKTIQGFLFSKPLSEEEFTRIQQDSMHMQSVITRVRQELAG